MTNGILICLINLGKLCRDYRRLFDSEQSKESIGFIVVVFFYIDP